MISYQGKFVIEQQDEPKGWLAMAPDGDVRFLARKDRAERLARKWFREHAGPGSLHVRDIEWRLR